jgi:hypothetical protein
VIILRLPELPIFFKFMNVKLFWELALAQFVVLELLLVLGEPSILVHVAEFVVE